MGPTGQFSVTLPLDVIETVEAKVRSGAYTSVSEVLRDGVNALLDRDAPLECWLREDVLSGHAEYMADTSKGVPANEILERIKARASANSR